MIIQDQNDITTHLRKVPKKHRVHEHFTTGKGGYIPQSAGQNPYSHQGRRVFYG